MNLKYLNLLLLLISIIIAYYGFTSDSLFSPAAIMIGFFGIGYNTTILIK